MSRKPMTPKAKADEGGEVLSEVIRKALERYLSTTCDDKFCGHNGYEVV